MDALADNAFPIRILVRRTHAGNFTIVRTARMTQDALSSGNAVFAFTANQIRELIITRTTFTTNVGDPIYAANMIDGISANTMVEKGQETTTGFKNLAYLFDRYFHLYRGDWTSGGYYKTADIVSNRGRLFIAFTDNGPSALEPYRSTNWHPLDANVSYRGPFISGAARYVLGNIVLQNGILYMLIADSLTNSVTAPASDPTRWLPLNQQAASQSEVNLGLNTSKFVNPLTLKQRLSSIPAGAGGGGVTTVDMDGYTYLRLETDGQTVSSSSATRQINKVQAENKDISLSGTASNDGDAIRLVVSTQGQNAAYWNDVKFVISNGTDTDIDNFAIANGTGNGGVISGSDIRTIPSKRRAIVRVSTSSTPTLAVNGLTLTVELIDGAAGDFATNQEARELVSTNKALTPSNLDEVIEAFARRDGVHNRAKLTIDRIKDANQHADNAGSIDEIIGFDNVFLMFKARTEIGHPDERWVIVNADGIFDIGAVQIGTDDNPNKQHNYSLVFRNGVIRHEHTLSPLDLDNLIGLTFVEYPTPRSSGGNGDFLIHRLSTPWVDEAGNGLATLVKSTDDVAITIPAKRNDQTRTITHILVRAGRVSGIDDTTSRTDIINATRADSAIFSEIIVPISMSYSNSENAPDSDIRYKNYSAAFANASGASCGIRVGHTTRTGVGQIAAVAHHGTSNAGFNGTEFLSFHAIRAIGG